jgi:cytidylate kinase
MTVITLSRQLGSHGEEIAIQVAQALNLRLIDAEAINRAAQKAGVPQIALAEMEHGRERSLTNRVLNALQAMPSLSPLSETGSAYPDLSSMTIPFAGLFSTTVPPLSIWLDGYVRMVGLVVRGLAQEGNVLLVGRGSQVLLRDHPQVLHVQVVAPPAHRLEVVIKRHDLSKRDAQSRIRASDRARFDYVRRYHDADWLDPTLYHLVINTAWLSVPMAVKLIIDTQRALAQAPDGDEDHA